MRLIKQILPTLGSDVVVISVDIDPTENADLLRRYAEREGAPWRFAVAPREMLLAFEQAFGFRFLDPPSEPKLIIDARGAVHVEFGFKQESELRALVARYRA